MDSAMDAPVDPARCPLCGEGNACGAAAGEPTCWCYGAAIPAEVLGRIPPPAAGVACVCRRCAEQREQPPSGSSTGNS
jgi:hypothetical protein